MTVKERCDHPQLQNVGCVMSLGVALCAWALWLPEGLEERAPPTAPCATVPTLCMFCLGVCSPVLSRIQCVIQRQTW